MLFALPRFGKASGPSASKAEKKEKGAGSKKGAQPQLQPKKVPRGVALLVFSVVTGLFGSSVRNKLTAGGGGKAGSKKKGR